MGANIPGKPRVSLMYLGGFTEYNRRCGVALAHRHSEFLLSPPAATPNADALGEA